MDNESCASLESEDGGFIATPTNQHLIPVESRHRFDKLAKNSISLRRNHAIAVASNGTSLYLFGGESKPSGAEDVTILSDMYRFDSESSLWTEIIPPEDGPWPQKRKGHTLICAGNSLYMFGGMRSLGNVFQKKPSSVQLRHTSSHLQKVSASTPAPADSFVYFQEVWCFDLSGQWREIATAEERAPPGRAFHTATLHENFMIVYGGYGCHEDPDIWMFNLDDTLWYRVAEPASSIVKLPRRFGHVATVFRQCLYIFGGQQKSKLCDSSVWKIPIANLHLVPLVGPRHQTNGEPKQQAWTWMKIESVNAPQNKTSLAAARLERKWLMHGGSSKGAICNSFHEFDLLTEKWRVLTQVFHPSPILDKHKAEVVFFGDHIASFVLTGGSKPVGSSVASHNHASVGYRVDFILPLNNQPYPAKLEDSFVGWQVREVLLNCRSVIVARNGEIHRLKRSIQQVEGMNRQELATLGKRYEALLRVEEDLRKRLAERRMPAESGTPEQEAVEHKIRNELESLLPGFVEICDRYGRLTQLLSNHAHVQAKRAEIENLEVVLSELEMEYEEMISWSKKLGSLGKHNTSLKPSDILEKIRAGRKAVLHRLKDVFRRYSDIMTLDEQGMMVSERAKETATKYEETIQMYKQEQRHMKALQEQRLEELQKQNDERLESLQKLHEARVEEVQTQKDLYQNKYERMIKSYDKLERRYLSLLRGNDSWEDSVSDDEGQATNEGSDEESGETERGSDLSDDTGSARESRSQSSSERQNESNSSDDNTPSRPTAKTLVVQGYDNKREYYAKVKKVHLAVRQFFQREGGPSAEVDLPGQPEGETWQGIRRQYAQVTKHYYKMVEKFTEWTQETNEHAQAHQEAELESLEKKYEKLVTDYLGKTETYVRDRKPSEIERRRMSMEVAMQSEAKQRKRSSIILLKNLSDIKEKCKEIEEAYAELFVNYETLHHEYLVRSEELDTKNDKYVKLLSFYEHLKMKMTAPQQKNELERFKTKQTSIVKTAIERTTTSIGPQTSSLSGDNGPDYVATFKPVVFARSASNAFSHRDSETISTTDKRSERTVTTGFSGPAYRSSLSSVTNSRWVDEQTRSTTKPLTAIPLKTKRHHNEERFIDQLGSG